LDCCRQVPPENLKGLVEEKTAGQLFLIHAVGPGKSAVTRPVASSLSEVTKDFLNIMGNATMTFPSCVKTWIKWHQTVEAVDKTKWEFPLLLGSKFVETEFHNDKKFEEWEPHILTEWLSTLKLSEDYSAIILREKVDGAGLVIIRDRDEWKEFGFGSRMDVSKIKTGMEKLVHKKT